MPPARFRLVRGAFALRAEPDGRGAVRATEPGVAVRCCRGGRRRTARRAEGRSRSRRVSSLRFRLFTSHPEAKEAARKGGASSSASGLRARCRQTAGSEDEQRNETSPIAGNRATSFKGSKFLFFHGKRKTKPIIGARLPSRTESGRSGARATRRGSFPGERTPPPGDEDLDSQPSLQSVSGPLPEPLYCGPRHAARTQARDAARSRPGARGKLRAAAACRARLLGGRAGGAGRAPPLAQQGSWLSASVRAVPTESDGYAREPLTGGGTVAVRFFSLSPSLDFRMMWIRNRVVRRVHSAQAPLPSGPREDSGRRRRDPKAGRSQ